MRARRDPASGALEAAVALLLLVAGLAAGRGPSPSAVCEHPSEAVADGAWTVRVECGPEGRERPLRGASQLLFGGRLDPNRAPGEVLPVLPGIGPARARGIVAQRALEPFASLADLERVRGIGPATVAGLAGWAEVRPDGRRGTSNGSQKRLQFLPKASETSYKDRARPARSADACTGSTAPRRAGELRWFEGLARVTRTPDMPLRACRHLQGGFPPCD